MRDGAPPINGDGFSDGLRDQSESPFFDRLDQTLPEIHRNIAEGNAVLRTFRPGKTGFDACQIKFNCTGKNRIFPSG